MIATEEWIAPEIPPIDGRFVQLLTEMHKGPDIVQIGWFDQGIGKWYARGPSPRQYKKVIGWKPLTDEMQKCLPAPVYQLDSWLDRLIRRFK